MSDTDDIFTRADIEPATQALLARLPKTGETFGQYDTDTTSTAHAYADRTTPQHLDCDGIPSEVANASALLDRVCEVLGVPLVDLLRTVEALPRWVPVESVKDGTAFYASARPPHFSSVVPTDDDSVPVELRMCVEWREHLQSGYVLINGLYPRYPKVDP